MINNNLSDYLVKSKYGKVLQTALYQQNYVSFEFQTGGGGSTPATPLWVRHWITTFSRDHVGANLFSATYFVGDPFRHRSFQRQFGAP